MWSLLLAIPREVVVLLLIQRCVDMCILPSQSAGVIVLSLFERSVWFELWAVCVVLVS